MGAQASHLLALDGLRISWARRAVQICIGSDANLISTIVAKKSIGGMHLADFTTVFRHARDLDPVLRRPDSNRDSHERACFRPRLYRRRDQNVETVLNVARSERGSMWILATALLLSFAGGAAFAAEPVKIGHVAALSGAS